MDEMRNKTKSEEQAPLHPDEALRLIESWSGQIKQESLELASCLGRALIQNIPALIDQPPFDKSAMDGFAYPDCPPDKVPGPWTVLGTLAAGAGPEAPASSAGRCLRIMTGAPVPPWAVGVQRVEWTETSYSESGNESIIFTKRESGSNIIRRAENQRAGDTLMTPRILCPQDIGILASSGYSRLSVAARPRLAVISTGDELCSAGNELLPAQIYDSNGPQLTALAAASGCHARFLGIVKDDPQLLRSVLEKALDEHDVIILSGGVSLGNFDYVPQVLAELSVKTVYHGLAMRPGKPSYYGLKGDTAVFGLPGNPVSTFVNFEVLVRPYLYRRLGLSYEPRLIVCELAEPLKRKGSDRVEFLPGRLDAQGSMTGDPNGPCRVRPISYKGSSMLNALADADCLLRMELGQERIEAGRTVYARLIRS